VEVLQAAFQDALANLYALVVVVHHEVDVVHQDAPDDLVVDGLEVVEVLIACQDGFEEVSHQDDFAVELEVLLDDLVGAVDLPYDSDALEEVVDLDAENALEEVHLDGPVEEVHRDVLVVDLLGLDPLHAMVAFQGVDDRWEECLHVTGEAYANLED